MRHIIVATTMLMIALAVTFTAASVLQGAAVAKSGANSEPYVVVEAAKPSWAKPVGNKERLTSQFRERSVQTSAQVGL
jgi:hypothetical protein